MDFTPVRLRLAGRGRLSWRTLLSLFLVLGVVGTETRAASAKAAWKDIEKLAKTSLERAEKQGATETDSFNFLNLLNFRLEDFIAKYPGDSYRWDAEVMRLPIVAQLAVANRTELDWAAQQAGYAAVLAAPNASATAKLSAQSGLFDVRLTLLRGTTDTAALVALAQEVDAYYTGHRGNARVAQIAYDVAKAVLPVDGARSESILKKIAADGDGTLPTKAESLLRVAHGRNTPLELAFTALDGRKVDLAALRGKVVLIDFWATWCPPCRDETPEIVANYRRLNAEGFEIIGISLDEDRAKLRSYVQQHGMSWPQHYDGRGWENQYAQRFGIHSIPAMWLVNKRGFLVDVDGREDLEEKVKRLLAE